MSISLQFWNKELGKLKIEDLAGFSQQLRQFSEMRNLDRAQEAHLLMSAAEFLTDVRRDPWKEGAIREAKRARSLILYAISRVREARVEREDDGLRDLAWELTAALVPKVRRHMGLPELINILATQRLVLRDPDEWDDKADRTAIGTFKTSHSFESVLALCFSETSETYHQWKVFSPGASGVRVSFDVDGLRRTMSQIEGLELSPIVYHSNKELGRHRPPSFELPFIKREQYEPEGEVRLLWRSPSQHQHAMSVPFDLRSITEIRLSPWLHVSQLDDVRNTIKLINGCGDCKIVRSSLIDDAIWAGGWPAGVRACCADSEAQLR